MKYDVNNLTIDTLFEQQVQLSPETQAVSFQGESLSYQELDSKANQLAHYLQDQGVTVDSLVGICLDRSVNLIVSVLAIFKAGATYLPLDQAYPADRLRFMIEDSAVPLIITQKHLDETLPSTGEKRIFLDCEAACIAHFPNSQPSKQTTPDSLAYVIYTSGSTGKPKGVAMHHRPLVNLLNWQKQQFKNPQARTLQFTPISFDVSFQEIFSTLVNGGTVVLIGDTDRRNSETLLAYLCENSIERLFLPFIALQNLAEAATTTQKLPVRLQEIVTAGEQLKITRSIVSLFDRLQDCSLVNQYGPSESHVVTQYVLTGSPKEWPHLPPIGRPIDNTQLYLLKTPSRREDDPIALAEPGEPGELAIGGICLAKGYLNQPELTRSRFIENPFVDESEAILYRTGDLVKRSTTGELEYIERLDDQVKIRGIRIELGEVEAQVSQHAQVKANAISARKRADGTTYLAAYIVPDSLEHLQNSVELELQLRTFLKERLPIFMIPTFFEFLPTLPLTPSGKVDRRALPEPHQERPALGQDYLQPRTDIEKKLAELWSEILEFKKIGVKDNFFECGGDSLGAMQLAHAIRETFEISLSINTLLSLPTIQELAREIESLTNHSEISCPFNSFTSQLEYDAIPRLDHNLSIQPFSFTSSPSNILITGSTGFLGAYLLNQVLKQTQAKAHCLVRAKNHVEGSSRIQCNLEAYGLWKPEYGHRIQPVLGDLALSNLGIEPDVFEQLSNKIEAIYHSGAAVNVVYPYSSLYATNVGGTENLLRLASKSRLIPFHFISTLDVFQTKGTFNSGLASESSTLNPTEAFEFDGYATTKWVAEKMVWHAQSLGLPVSVYRPTMISGDSQTGVCNTTDLVSYLVKGFIQLGAAPKMNTVLNLVPVDYVSNSIIHLSLQQESLNKAFNLVNSIPISMNSFIESISQYGYPLDVLEPDDWSHLLNKLNHQADGLMATLTLSEQKNVENYMVRTSINASQAPNENVLQGLKDTVITCPEISFELLKSYYRYLERANLFGFSSKLSNAT